MGTGREPSIRVGTTDRERAVAALSEHLAEGRLQVAEYESRCAAAAAAITRDDLLALFDDLPPPHPRLDGGGPPGPVEVVAEARDPLIESSGRRGTNIALTVFVVVAVVSVVSVAAITGTWWALAPALLIGLLFLLMS